MHASVVTPFGQVVDASASGAVAAGWDETFEAQTVDGITVYDPSGGIR